MKSKDIQPGEEESILSSEQLAMICEQLEEISQLCAVKISENVKMAWSVSQTPAGTTRNVVLEIIVGYGPDLEKGRYPKDGLREYHKFIHFFRKDLRGTAWEACVSKKIAEMDPRHVWISNFISDMTPKEEKQLLET